MIKDSTQKSALVVFTHIGFWSLVFLWPLLSFEELTRMPYLINRNWLSTLCLFITFYANYFYLVDKYFFNGKKVFFYVLNVFLVAVILFLVDYVSRFDAFMPIVNGVGIREVRSVTIPVLQLIVSLILSIGMCVGLKTNRKWIANELQLQRVKQTQLDSEIKYLKYQIQPHFLFNTLNNIYALIDSAPNNAKNSVHSLSKMMRYLLHDSTSDKVSLVQEINFLERFIELMQLRVSSNIKLEKHFPVINQPIQIAPLLLITFVENAFKHGIDAVQPSKIKIELTIENDYIHYCVVNTSFPQQERITDSGIGLENLKKRLELLYPNRFKLSQETHNNLYAAKLTLNYKE